MFLLFLSLLKDGVAGGLLLEHEPGVVLFGGDPLGLSLHLGDDLALLFDLLEGIGDALLASLAHRQQLVVGVLLLLLHLATQRGRLLDGALHALAEVLDAQIVLLAARQRRVVRRAAHQHLHLQPLARLAQ